MALYHYVLATSLLLCSLLAIANAGGEYGSQSQPSYEYDHSSIKAPKAEETKPEENATYPDNTNAPKPSSDNKEKKYYAPVENEEKRTGGEYESQSKEKKKENETYKQTDNHYSSTEAPKVEETKSEDKATYPVSYAPKPSTGNENMKNYAPTKKEEQKNGGEYEQSETSHDQYDHSSWLKLKVEVKPTQYEENKKEKETYKQTDDGYSSTEAPKDEEKKPEEKVTYPVNHAPKPSTDDKEKKYYAPVEKEEKKTNDNQYESQSEEKKKENENETYKQTDNSYGSTNAAKTKETKPKEKMTYPTNSYASKPNIDNKEKKDYAPVEKEEKKNGGDYVSQSEEKKKEKETYKQMDNGYISTEGPKAKETKQEENMTYPATSYSLKPNTDDKEKKNYVPIEKEEKKNGGDYVSQSEEKKKDKETYKQMESAYSSTERPKAKETKQEEKSTYPTSSYASKPSTGEKEEKNYAPVEKEETKTSYGSTQTESVKRATCEGIVLCKTGKNTFDAIKGAIVKITCETVNEYGYEILPASTYISKTNNEGYFLVPIPRLLKLDQSKYSKYTSCKAEIEHSSTEKCKIPFNGDKWKSSSTYLSSYRILHDRQVKLYSVGPFVFTQEQEQQHTATPTGY